MYFKCQLLRFLERCGQWRGKRADLGLMVGIKHGSSLDGFTINGICKMFLKANIDLKIDIVKDF